MKIKLIYIYVLINPLNNSIFYVGFTNNLTRRLNEHIKQKYNPFKDLIISEIISSGLKPIIKSVDSCDFKFNTKLNMYEHENLEIFYIKKYRDEGVELSNMTDGGGSANMNTKPVFQFDEFGNYIKKIQFND